jgi:hypothetical protein
VASFPQVSPPKLCMHLSSYPHGMNAITNKGCSEILRNLCLYIPVCRGTTSVIVTSFYTNNVVINC